MPKQILYSVAASLTSLYLWEVVLKPKLQTKQQVSEEPSTDDASKWYQLF